jgi:hypothetical protein
MDRRDLLKSAIVGAAIAGPVIAEAAEQKPKLEIKKKGYITLECQNITRKQNDWLLEPTVFRIDMISNIRPILLEIGSQHYTHSPMHATTYDMRDQYRGTADEVEAQLKSKINGSSFFSQGQMYAVYKKPEELVAMLEEKMS